MYGKPSSDTLEVLGKSSAYPRKHMSSTDSSNMFFCNTTTSGSPDHLAKKMIDISETSPETYK